MERRDSPMQKEHDVWVFLNLAGGWMGSRVHLSEEAALRWAEDTGHVVTDMTPLVPAKLVINHAWMWKKEQ